MKPHSNEEFTSEELNVSVIRFLLLCLCLGSISLVGITPAKAEHISSLPSVDFSIATSATDSISFEPSSIDPNSTDQSMAPTCKVQSLSTSNLHCVPNLTSSHSLDFTSSIDLNHDIYVNSFSLRFAHGNFNSDELIPDYVKVFEFSEVSLASSARHYVECFRPQHHWMMQTNSQSLRLSSWKDSNLQYIPQQYAHLFA